MLNQVPMSSSWTADMSQNFTTHFFLMDSGVSSSWYMIIRIDNVIVDVSLKMNKLNYSIYIST